MAQLPRNSPFRTTQKGRVTPRKKVTLKAARENIATTAITRNSITQGGLGPHRETHLHDGSDSMIEINASEPEDTDAGFIWVVTQPAASWADVVYTLTSAGVFYTSTFNETYPTWTTLNDGLPTTISVYRKIVADPINGMPRMWLLLDNSATSQSELYVYNAGTWTYLINADTLETQVMTDWGASSAVLFIQSIVADPTTAGRLYAFAVGQLGGLYFLSHNDYRAVCFISSDYGATWATMTMPTFYGSGDLMQSPNCTVNVANAGIYNGATLLTIALYSSGVYAGSQLYRSVDSGLTWTSAASAQPTGQNWENLRLTIDEYTGDLYAEDVYANTWQSTDMGDTWTQIRTGDGSYGYATLASVTSTAYANNLLQFYTVGGFSYRIATSTNYGGAWNVGTPTGLPGSFPSAARLMIYAHYTAPTALYGAILTHSSYGGASVYVSDDNGATWTAKAGEDITSDTTTGIPDSTDVYQIIPVVNP